MFEGRATRQLSGTRKPNPWALTAPYLGPIEGLGYIWTCTLQIYPEVPLKKFFFAKVVRKHGSRCFPAMRHFWMQCLLTDPV